MTQPILVLVAGTDRSEQLCGEILRCEGFPWLVELPADQFSARPDPDVRVVVVAGVGVGPDCARQLATAVANGVDLIATAPDPDIADALGIGIQQPATDAKFVVTHLEGWEHGAVPLLCPDATSAHLLGGQRVGVLQNHEGEILGNGLTEATIGRGRAWLYGYDLCRVIATLRHGNGDLDERPERDMGPLYGPRHIYGYFELSSKLERTMPVADLHQDVLRSLVALVLKEAGFPRCWYYPDAASALWFVKGDGCGEDGADVLVDLLEQHDARLTFYSAPQSKYQRDLLDWHERGHGVSIEADISDITQTTETTNGALTRRGRSVAEINLRYLDAIRVRLEAHRDEFEQLTGLTMDTVCIHGCQWTGLPLAKVVRELGWHTPTHFISHDPRMRFGDRYGPYMIASGLPMRYFDRTEGLLDLWHMPAQWDESQTIGLHDELTNNKDPDVAEKARGIVGLTAEEYGLQLTRFALDAAHRWHVVQIANFHPTYVAGPQNHPRASRRALVLGLQGAQDAGCSFSNLETWSRFSRGRAALQLTEWHRDAASIDATFRSDIALAGLTLLLPPCIRGVRDRNSGHDIQVELRELEARSRTTLTIDLEAGVPRRFHLMLGEEAHKRTDVP